MDACIAIGGGDTTSGDKPFGEAWNGTNWTLQSIPSGASTDLFGLSCLAPADCTAVGRVFDPDQLAVPLAETWNGTSWTSQRLPLLPGSDDGTLVSVSCTSTTRCVAVGYAGRPGPFSENWNGTRWTPHSAPLPAGDVSGEFLGVSCRAYSSCIAVGEVETSSRSIVPLAESWNGHQWSTQEAPAPRGVNADTSLQAVSCHSRTACMAVGGRGDGHTFQTLAERWDGTAWTIVSMPRIGGGKAQSYLYSVSCPGAAQCTAVGQRTVQDNRGLLAENWKGTRWRVAHTVKPPGIGDNSFDGVSCLAGQGEQDCMAVGNYTATTTGRDGLLAEQHS